MCSSGRKEDVGTLSSATTLSVVIPIYCEEETLEELYARLQRTLKSLRPRYRAEIIFVNDGSTDRTASILAQLRERDSTVKILTFSRNFGHQKAITAGMDHAFGDIVVVMDGDLQDPPEIIPKMIEKWEAGYQVVYGTRSKRKGESFFKLFTARLFYAIIQKLSDVALVRDSGDFRLLDRAVIAALREIREENRYIRGLISWVGFSQTSLPYERDPRFAGETKFTLRKMLKFAFDGFTGFSEKPLQIATQLGAFLTLISFLLTVHLAIEKVLHPEQSVLGWTSLMIAICIIGGIQLLAVGILGEYIGRIYREIKYRPLYIIAQKTGFDPDPLPSPPRRRKSVQAPRKGIP
mgnify:CR=1 FL=1